MAVQVTYHQWWEVTIDPPHVGNNIAFWGYIRSAEGDIMDWLDENIGPEHWIDVEGSDHHSKTTRTLYEKISNRFIFRVDSENAATLVKIKFS